MTIIDVRTKEEFDEGHLKGAVNLDFYREDFREELEKLDKSKKYKVYCQSGNRSEKVVAKMKKMGFDVEDLGCMDSKVE